MEAASRASEIVLALDTGSPVVSVAVADGARVLAQRSTPIGRSSERLLAMIDESLQAAGCPLGDLSGILALSGPGSFTGLRVGLATVLGFHQALQLRVGAVPTLRVLAESVSSDSDTVVALVDGIRDQWFVQTFVRRASLAPRGCVELYPTAALGKIEPATVVGFGVERLASVLPKHRFTVIEANPLAATAACMAASWSAWNSADLTRPLYCRQPAVTLPRPQLDSSSVNPR